MQCSDSDDDDDGDVGEMEEREQFGEDGVDAGAGQVIAYQRELAELPAAAQFPQPRSTGDRSVMTGRDISNFSGYVWGFLANFTDNKIKMIRCEILFAKINYKYAPFINRTAAARHHTNAKGRLRFTHHGLRI